jgi:hypothetical protein
MPSKLFALLPLIAAAAFAQDLLRSNCAGASKETSSWLKRGMLDKARDVHFALVLACPGKIIRRLHSQPHIGTAAKGLFKTQRHLWRKGASALHYVVKLLARDLHGFRCRSHT